MSRTDLVIVIALVAFAVYRQTRVNRVTGRGRFTLAIGYTAAGLLVGVHIGAEYVGGALFAAGIAASLLVGVLRARRTRLWIGADGTVFSQGTAVTIGLFFGLLAVKFALGTIAYFAGVAYDTGIGDVLVLLGAMLAVQAELIWRRAQALTADVAVQPMVTASIRPAATRADGSRTRS